MPEMAPAYYNRGNLYMRIGRPATRCRLRQGDRRSRRTWRAARRPRPRAEGVAAKRRGEGELRPRGELDPKYAELAKKDNAARRARARPPASRRSGRRGAAAQLVAAPEIMFQSSSTCAAAHASSTVSRPAASASASSAEPVSVVTTLSAPSRHGVCRDRRAAAAIAASGCATCMTPSTSTKRAPSVSRAHSTIGSQCCALAGDQSGGSSAR